MMLYGSGSFLSSSSKDEDCVSTGSMKGHFLTRSAGEHRTSRGCLFSQRNDPVPVTPDGGVRRRVHRWIGVAALRAIWEEELDGVKAHRRE